MNPRKVDRHRLVALTDLPNVGEATAGDLRRLGFNAPADLVGQCPFAMYERLCELTGVRHDPCVIDVFMAVTRFMDGESPRDWWAYTGERKRRLQGAFSTANARDLGNIRLTPASPGD